MGNSRWRLCILLGRLARPFTHVRFEYGTGFKWCNGLPVHHFERQINSYCLKYVLEIMVTLYDEYISPETCIKSSNYVGYMLENTQQSPHLMYVALHLICTCFTLTLNTCCVWSADLYGFFQEARCLRWHEKAMLWERFHLNYSDKRLQRMSTRYSHPLY